MAKWSEDALDYYEYTKPQTVLDMVREFVTLTEQTPNTMLYADLITEEFEEWREERVETPEELKELADLVYVIYGYANAAGYDLDEAVLRVHRNNMGRCQQDDGTILRREDGKIIKNPNYPKVDLEDLI